jgi:phosphoheptose isomerase
MLTNFENIEQKLSDAVKTEEWKTLQRMFNNAEIIYMIGNGGNMAVASHGAADATRLTDKKVHCLDSQSHLTSIANDHGYDNIFEKWLESYADLDKKTLVLGFSGSGNSNNVLGGLYWADDQGFDTTIISGVNSTRKSRPLNEVCFNNIYFHTHEILSVMSFYELIHGTGNNCPTIEAENERKYGAVGAKHV